MLKLTFIISELFLFKWQVSVSIMDDHLALSSNRLYHQRKVEKDTQMLMDEYGLHIVCAAPFSRGI